MERLHIHLLVMTFSLMLGTRGHWGVILYAMFTSTLPFDDSKYADGSSDLDLYVHSSWNPGLFFFDST